MFVTFTVSTPTSIEISALKLLFMNRIILTDKFKLNVSTKNYDNQNKDLLSDLFTISELSCHSSGNTLSERNKYHPLDSSRGIFLINTFVITLSVMCTPEKST